MVMYFAHRTAIEQAGGENQGRSFREQRPEIGRRRLNR